MATTSRHPKVASVAFAAGILLLIAHAIGTHHRNRVWLEYLTSITPMHSVGLAMCTIS